MTDRRADELAQLRASASGWHGVQLAVLGFIGLCGVLQGVADAGNPRWLEILAGILVLLALLLACVATALVAGVAWPVATSVQPDEESSADMATVRRLARRLRAGIATTFASVLVLAVAATSSWWPGDAGASLVRLTTQGGSVCGELSESGSGRVGVRVSGRVVEVAVADVVALIPVESCD